MYTKGSALLDAIIAIALFSILFTGFFALMQVGVKTISDHKARAGALALARSQIEYVRSLGYTSVGVVGGSPSGSIPVSTTDTLNGLVYTIVTRIDWHDNSDDGVGGGDSNPQDYKNLQVEVVWPEHAGQSGSVTLSTFVADFEVE